jgi:hypothetical protein
MHALWARQEGDQLRSFAPNPSREDLYWLWRLPQFIVPLNGLSSNFLPSSMLFSWTSGAISFPLPFLAAFKPSALAAATDENLEPASGREDAGEGAVATEVAREESREVREREVEEVLSMRSSTKSEPVL